MKKTRKINLLEAQKTYETMKSAKKFVPFKVFTCPKNCKGRKLNNNKCTPDNCIKLNRKSKALTAIKVTANPEVKRRVRKYGRDDVKTLLAISDCRAVSSGFRWRTDTRQEIKQQLNSLGRKMPRLIDIDKRKLKLINETRIKMGLKPLGGTK